ncbi:MAG: hypothetical protein DMF88_06770 [Acidobacteria bacterium]|nr:MAG: hypothetical protein DMF88_06770 [Acidobacteriota bacterium]
MMLKLSTSRVGIVAALTVPVVSGFSRTSVVCVARAARARSTSRAVVSTAARMARALMVAPSTKSGGSEVVPPRSGLPASAARNSSSCR